MSVGAAGLLVGGVTYVAAKGRESDLESICQGDSCPSRAESEIDSYDRLRAISLVGLTLGGLGAAVGATLLLGDPEAKPPAVSVQPWLGVGSAGCSGVF